ncbi:MAG: hypothetical protein ACUVXI_17240 [bacterium]
MAELKPHYYEIIGDLRVKILKDIEDGVDPTEKFTCAFCGLDKTLPGSMVYDGIHLCNNCAILFELNRADGNIKDIHEFVSLK